MGGQGVIKKDDIFGRGSVDRWQWQQCKKEGICWQYVDQQTLIYSEISIVLDILCNIRVCTQSTEMNIHCQPTIS